MFFYSDVPSEPMKELWADSIEELQGFFNYAGISVQLADLWARDLAVYDGIASIDRLQTELEEGTLDDLLLSIATFQNKPTAADISLIRNALSGEALPVVAIQSPEVSVASPQRLEDLIIVHLDSDFD